MKQIEMLVIPIEVKFLMLLLEDELEWQNLEEIDEQEWLYAVARNPKFDFLKYPEEDIYKLTDGKPFTY